MTEATTAKVIQARQRLCSNAMQAAITITTTKVWACTSGIKPAITPAAIICWLADTRLEETGESILPARLLFFALAAFFERPSAAVSPLRSPSDAAAVASHHCVNTITARGRPNRKPRCGISKADTAFPQRHVVSGMIVNETGSDFTESAKV